MRTLLSRIPVLEQAENDLARLMNAVKIVSLFLLAYIGFSVSFC